MICACENEFYFFESLAKKQTQIYPDACDIGYYYSEDEGQKIKENLLRLREVYINTVEHYGDDYPQRGGWTCSMFIPFERDEGLYRGVKLDVSCHRDKHKKFVSVNITSHTSSEDGYKNNS